jgi:hypothetical protein
MKYRNIVFLDKDGKMYATPEYKGDKREIESYRSADSKGDTFEKNWEEVLDEFRGVESLDEFKKITEKTQRYAKSCSGNVEIRPAEEIADIKYVVGDEVYLIVNGCIFLMV